MLIDDYLPSFDVVERHQTKILAPPSRVFAALRTTDFSSSRVTGVLLALRALPAALARGLGSRAPQRRRSARLDDFLDHGFAILDERPNEELLIGVVGRFWTPAGGLVPTDARRFREPLAKGLAQGAWNFSIVPDGAGCVLRTETRVRCARFDGPPSATIRAPHSSADEGRGVPGTVVRPRRGAEIERLGARVSFRRSRPASRPFDARHAHGAVMLALPTFLAAIRPPVVVAVRASRNAESPGTS